MVRISSKVSYPRKQPKEKVSQKSTELKSNTNEESSSKILNVVRQALLNAAEELVAQQHPNNNQRLNSVIPFHELDSKNNASNKSSCEQNSNAIEEKKVKRKRRKISKTNRRK